MLNYDALISSQNYIYARFTAMRNMTSMSVGLPLFIPKNWMVEVAICANVSGVPGAVSGSAKTIGCHNETSEEAYQNTEEITYLPVGAGGESLMFQPKIRFRSVNMGVSITEGTTYWIRLRCLKVSDSS